MDQDALRAALEPLIAEHDLELDTITVHHRSGTTRVTVVVDLPADEIGAVDLDAVADVSEQISAFMDDNDQLLGDGPSMLEVTTPGVDRALREERHVRRSRGRVITKPGAAHGHDLRARVIDVHDDGVIVRHEPGRDDRGRPLPLPPGTPALERLPLSEVYGATTVIEFNPPADLHAEVQAALREWEGASPRATDDSHAKEK